MHGPRGGASRVPAATSTRPTVPVGGGAAWPAAAPLGDPHTPTTSTPRSLPRVSRRRGGASLIGVVVAILAGVGVAGFFALRDDDSSAEPSDTVETRGERSRGA